MAYIELVIKIPEEVKHKVYAYGLSLCPSDKEQLIHAIMNGIPLPKRHGKIVDANRVLENGDNWEVETALMQTEAIIEEDEE